MSKLKKSIIIILILITNIGYSQSVNDTLNYLKAYSHNYLELLFNKRNIDSAMLLWDKVILDELKTDYSNHKQKCDTDSILKLLFRNDINNFCSRVKGNITFFAVDDKEGVNIKYLPTSDEGYHFLINYDFFGDFESHNLLMRTSLNFYSTDKGKTWTLSQDSWIRNYIILNYYRKDYYGTVNNDGHSLKRT